MPLTDEIRCLKAVVAINQVTSLAARPIFDRYFPADGLHLRLEHIFSDICNNDAFTKEQINILDPKKNKNSSSTNYDIELMIKLLKDYSMINQPKNGFDKLPPTPETSDGADLARIKYWRNKIFHRTGPMTTSELEELIKEFNAVTQRHSGRNVLQESDDAIDGTKVYKVYSNSGKIAVIIIAVPGVVYVWCIISNIRNDILRRNREHVAVMLDVKSLNKKDKTRLTAWSHDLYKTGNKTEPFPLIVSRLSWRVPDIEMRSSCLSFKLPDCANVEATKYLILSLCHLPRYNNNDTNERDDNETKKSDQDISIPLSLDTSDDTTSLCRQYCLRKNVKKITFRSTRTENDITPCAFSPTERHTYATITSSPTCIIGEKLPFSYPTSSSLICRPSTGSFLECSGRTTMTSSLPVGLNSDPYMSNTRSINCQSSPMMCRGLTQVEKERNTCVCS